MEPALRNWLPESPRDCHAPALFMLLVLSTAAPRFAVAETIDDWKVLPAPQRGEPMGHCENFSQFVWVVKPAQEGVTVDRQSLEEFYHWQLESARETPQYSVGKFKSFPRQTIDVPDGALVGYNRGEWGGAVWWFSRNHKKRREISRDQVLSFLEKDGEIYALKGLAHLGYSHGALIKFRSGGNGSWYAEAVAILPGEPGPYTWVGPKEILLIAGGKLVRLHLDGDRKTLHESQWGFGRASSLVAKGDGTVYVGSGGVVIRLTPQGDGYREEWLVRQSEVEACH